jgi:hypothetical protein
MSSPCKFRLSPLNVVQGKTPLLFHIDSGNAFNCCLFDKRTVPYGKYFLTEPFTTNMFPPPEYILYSVESF